jgi:ATP-dependent DNA helicase RecG
LVTGDKARYIRNRAFDDAHYKQVIVQYLKRYSNASRRDIDTLLLDKLSDVLSENQKRVKVKNLLAAMSRDGLVHDAGSRRSPR